MTESDFDANGHPTWVHKESLAPSRQMLEQVIDPELGYSIVGFGLVYGVTAAPDGTDCIEMTTTPTGCPAKRAKRMTTSSRCWKKPCVPWPQLARSMVLVVWPDAPMPHSGTFTPMRRGASTCCCIG